MPESPTSCRIVLTSVDGTRKAAHMAKKLVEEQLAACVTALWNAMSFYRWDGEMKSTEESVLLIKTTEGQLGALEKRLKELHSYETPEFLVLKVEGGSAEYLAWLQSSVRVPESES